MAHWIQVIRIGDIRPGRMRDFELLDGMMLGLANVDGTHHAFDATCPHRGGPLTRGRLEHGELLCPWHAYRYQIATGQNVAPGHGAPVQRFPVRERDGYVEVEIP